jgi:hypothetical protein
LTILPILPYFLKIPIRASVSKRVFNSLIFCSIQAYYSYMSTNPKSSGRFAKLGFFRKRKIGETSFPKKSYIFKEISIILHYFRDMQAGKQG